MPSPKSKISNTSKSNSSSVSRPQSTRNYEEIRFGAAAGGIVRRRFGKYHPGDRITAEEAQSWPLANRKALAGIRSVEWCLPLEDS